MMMESGMIDSMHEDNVEVDQLPLVVPIIDNYEPSGYIRTVTPTPYKSSSSPIRDSHTSYNSSYMADQDRLDSGEEDMDEDPYDLIGGSYNYSYLNNNININNSNSSNNNSRNNLNSSNNSNNSRSKRKSIESLPSSASSSSTTLLMMMGGGGGSYGDYNHHHNNSIGNRNSLNHIHNQHNSADTTNTYIKTSSSQYSLRNISLSDEDELVLNSNNSSVNYNSSSIYNNIHSNSILIGLQDQEMNNNMMVNNIGGVGSSSNVGSVDSGSNGVLGYGSPFNYYTPVLVSPSSSATPSPTPTSPTMKSNKYRNSTGTTITSSSSTNSNNNTNTINSNNNINNPILNTPTKSSSSSSKTNKKNAMYRKSDPTVTTPTKSMKDQLVKKQPTTVRDHYKDSFFDLVTPPPSPLKKNNIDTQQYNHYNHHQHQTLPYGQISTTSTPVKPSIHNNNNQFKSNGNSDSGILSDHQLSYSNDLLQQLYLVESQQQHQSNVQYNNNDNNYSGNQGRKEQNEVVEEQESIESKYKPITELDTTMLMDRIRENSKHYATQFFEMVVKVQSQSNLVNSLMSDNMDTLALTSTNVLDESYHSMTQMKSLINNMELLNSDLFHVYKLAAQIKQTKKTVKTLYKHIEKLSKNNNNNKFIYLFIISNTII